MDMRNNQLSYSEVVRKYNLGDPNIGGPRSMVKRWERIYLEDGEAGLYIERRGRQTKMENPNKGRPRKKPLPKNVEQDLITENQLLKEQVEYLQMENDYLKKLNALVREEEQRKNKRH